MPKTILRTALIFLLSYILSLILWIQVKDYYGYAAAYTAAKMVMVIKDVRVEGMTQEKDIVRTTFVHIRYDSMLMEIPVKVSNFTFNAPLTFSLMAALYLFIKRRRRAYAEAMLILFLVHLLYVFSFNAEQLTNIFIDRKIEKENFLCIFFYQFLWGFTDNMIVRFEPFLIGLYMYIRFRR